jgi:hypothetical protein
MQRIQDPSAVPFIPDIPPLAGPAGYFTGGNPNGGVPATVLRAWWLNMIQEELMTVVTAGGQTPNSNGDQLLAALCTLMEGAEVAFSTAGAFSTVAPAWARYADVTATGGGGGGAGCFGPLSQSGGGGGAGLTARGRYPVTGGLTYNGVVGAGGAGGDTGNAAAGGPGGTGGATSFSTFISAAGGFGGRADGGTASGGSGGSVAAGSYLWADKGGDGSDALGDSTTNAGTGGASHWGGGGRGGESAGLAGYAAGSGGGGAYRQAGLGGAGAMGRVVIQWLP